MLKLVETIVDNRRKLVGFTIEGKDSEFGGFSVEKVRKHIPLKTLAINKFENNQIAVNMNGVSEKSNFRINALPMVVLVDNKFIPIGNEITLKSRYIKDGDIVGFLVEFGDKSTENYTYPNVIKLSYWFKPTNFVIRKSQNGKAFIYGKPGVCRLDDLPYKSLDNKPVKKAVESELTEKDTVTEAGTVEDLGIFKNNVDIIDLYSALDECGGLILKLPNVQYTTGTINRTLTDKAFQPLGVGEYAYPRLQFNENKLNATTMFRKPGVVPIEFGPGAVMPIHSFTYKNKFVFMNSENYIERLGVAFPRQHENNFLGTFGKEMCLNKIEDTTMVKSVASLTNKRDLVYYELDTNKIDLITKKNAQSHILPTDKLFLAVVEYFICRCIVKYLSPNTGLLRDLKKKLKVDYREAQGKKAIPLYAAMSAEFQQKIEEEGIDIFSGAYLKTVEVDQEDMLETQRAKENEARAVFIEYAIKGYELKKWTYKKISEFGQAGVRLPKKIIHIVQKLSNMPDSPEKIKLAYETYKKYEKRAEELKNLLWLHKCSMYLTNNRVAIHQHDKENWELDTTRNTKAKVYNCKLEGCELMTVSIENTTI